MNWGCAAALMVLLLAPGVPSAAGSDTDVPDRTKLGEFVPSSAPSPAPSVTLTDAAGNALQLSDFRGKLVVLNLWATWCEPCLREMPSLDLLEAHFGDRIAVLAVSEDRGGAKIVEPFIAKLSLKSVKVFVDPKSEVGHAFDVRGLPTSFLVDHDGNVLGRVEGGADWDSAKMLAVIEPFVSGRGVVKASSR
jgi:thiol-disulfide isomerase/thioredoxin